MVSMESFKKPKGFINMYGHKEDFEFVSLNPNDPLQGYYKISQEKVVDERHFENLIVNKGSLLMAKRMAPGTSWGKGISYLEVGTGVGTGTTQNPQAAVLSDQALKVPFARKAISSWTYVDGSGNATVAETNVIDITTIFLESEAVGAIVEQGLWGGDATTSNGTGYMFNYKTFPVWNKQNDLKLTVVWRITF